MYFDNNATTRPCEAAVGAMVRACSELWHNPSSVHKAGQGARHAVEVARGQVAGLLEARARDVTFVSSGTEAIDMAIRGTLALAKRGGADGGVLPTLYTTRVEHAAIRELAEQLEKDGLARVVWLKLADGGVIDVDAAQRELVQAGGVRGSLTAVQWANNETGAVQPVRAIAALCRAAGVPLLVDGTQWVGKLPTDVASLGCDMLACSAHKFHGVKGCGVLWVRQGVPLKPVTIGTQELGRRGGTENVPAIVAAGAAAEEAREFVQDVARLQALSTMRDELEARVIAEVKRCAPRAAVHINKPASDWLDDAGVRTASRLWNTTNIGFAALEAEALLIAMSERGVMASAGAACSSGSLEPSPVLLAMGVPAEVAHGSVRLSLSRETTREEVERAARVIGEVVGRAG